MDASRWVHLKTLFHEALARARSERKAFLEEACEGDEALLADVLALLDADADPDSLLEGDLASVAGHVFDGSVPPLREVGDYRIMGVLGRGGMGVVYLGEDPGLKRKVAIKVLRDATLSPHRRARFAREEQVLAQLTHPSIARLYDADVLPDGTPYFVMEYVQGKALTAYCSKQRLSISARLRLFRAVCEAVQYAHQQLVIHRDLKPSNILVTDEGELRLLDFGIAKELDSVDAGAAMTQTGLRLMTPAYAAPEQLRGERVGVYTDVYALGVILYELLTGAPPFELEGLPPTERDRILLEQDPPPPSTRRRDGAPSGEEEMASTGRHNWKDLDVLCRTAMNKDPARRYASVESLLRDVDHYLEGEPLEARPDSLGYRLGKFVRRNRRQVAAVTTVVALVIGLVTFYTAQLTAARDAALEEAARTQRIQTFMLNLFEGGDAAVGPADTLRVVTLVDRGVLEAGMLVGDPDIQAELLYTLGGIYRQLGSYERADSLLQTTLRQRMTLQERRHSDVIESEIALGLLRLDQARLEEAEALTREALEKSRSQLPDDHPTAVRAATAVGQVLQSKAHYAEAIEVLGATVQTQLRRGAPEAERSPPLHQLANAYFYMGDYPVADSLNHVLLTMNQDLYGERHPRVADIYINLGAIQFQQAHYEDAEQHYRQALDIMEGYYGADHHRTASSLTMLGRALVYQGRYQESIALHQRALAIQERIHGPVHPRVASNLNDLGVVALQQARLADAETYFRRMADIYVEVYGPRHDLLGIALSNLASVYLEDGQYERAEPIFREVIDLFAETLSPENVNVGIAQIKLGRVLARLGRYAAAEEELWAGYELLTGQTSPSASWLQAARTDLITVYEALGEPERAAHFQDEWAAHADSS